MRCFFDSDEVKTLQNNHLCIGLKILKKRSKCLSDQPPTHRQEDIKKSFQIKHLRIDKKISKEDKKISRNPGVEGFAVAGDVKSLG